LKESFRNTGSLIAKLETLIENKSNQDKSNSSSSWREKMEDYLLNEGDPQNGSRGSQE
jgi:hypothetical protein